MLERIIKFSIENRWLVLLLTVVVAAIGVHSMMRLPIDAVPDITNNQVQINTLAPALSPLEIEKQVTFPIETALAGIPGLQSTRSLSRNGFSQVTAVFEDDVDIYFARQQVGERLQGARPSLPPDVEPAMGAISTGLGEVFMYTVEFAHEAGNGLAIVDGSPGWQSDGSYLTPEGQRLRSEFDRAAYLRTVQDWIIRPQLKGVKDVAGVDSIGGYEKQYHVQPDPMKLVSYGLGFHDVIEALERNNVSTGAGFIEHKGEAYNVRAAGRIENEDQIGGIVIGSRNGTPIYVRDVASVGIGRELRTGSATKNGEEVVVGTALMLIGANSRMVAASVAERIEIINRTLPPDIVANTVLNRTKLVDATVNTVSRNLMEGAILVIAVLFLLLGNIRAALITAMAIPLSMLITATGMVQSRISGNLMSLGAIDFGLIVDGAVIIVENTLRRLGEKQHELGRRLNLHERLHEVWLASREMIKPSVFGQAIIITVYLPILTLSGVEGKMFNPMAITVIFALLAAFVLSITFLPAMVAIGITGKVHEKENILINVGKKLFAPIVRWSIRFRWPVVISAFLIFFGSVALFMRLGQEFIPTLDEKDIAMHAMRIPSAGLTISTEMQKAIERELSALPEIAFVFSKTGTAEMASDPMPPNVSDTFIIVNPREAWRSGAELDRLIERKEKELAEIKSDAQPAHGEQQHDAIDASTQKGKLQRLIELTVNLLPGNNYEFTQPIQMRFNELIAGVRSDVAVKVYGDAFEKMTPAADRIAGILRNIPGAADVKVEQTEGLPMMNIDIDREAISRYGLNVADVQDVVGTAIGGRDVGEVFQGDRRFRLVVRLPDEMRRDMSALQALPVPLPKLGGERARDAIASIGMVAPGDKRPAFVPLGAVATINVAEGSNQIRRENGKRSIVVQANVRGRDIGSFVADAQQEIDAEAKVPPGSWLEWGGQFENLVAARERLLVVVPGCFLLIFILLFSTFNSVKYAMMVFTGVPLALTGGILALWLRGMPFSITAAIGFIALSGVAVLNGLVMVTFINQLRKSGLELDDAIIDGSLTRLRPVLMTALVASLGFVPMAIASGTGAEVQRPLATVVIGGIVSSTFLTLVVLPALYRLWHPAGSDNVTVLSAPVAPATQVLR
ncbi:MAG TPA: CusA/CzcA family heavy metal efflux RND transporter [Tepidisphaeraceae bacterium]|nr:CusA/CzcA family heavy metal efflux RND transporter [Tepidisphaeraceae bacterium]